MRFLNQIRFTYFRKRPLSSLTFMTTMPSHSVAPIECILNIAPEWLFKNTSLTVPHSFLHSINNSIVLRITFNCAYRISHNLDPVYFSILISRHLLILILHSSPEVTKRWLLGQIPPAVLTSLAADLLYSLICLQILLLSTQNSVQFFKCAHSLVSLKSFMCCSLHLEYSFLPFVTWLIPTIPFDSVIRQILPLIWNFCWSSKTE